MKYKIMITLWSGDYEDTYTEEYDGVTYYDLESANKALFNAKVHEVDNERLESLRIEVVGS